MATLRWTGDGEFMSWHWEKLGEAFEDGKVVSGPIRFEAVVTADKRESQSLTVSRAKHANGIALSLSSGEVGVWGVYDVRLTTEPTTYVPPSEPAEPPKKQTGFMIIIK